MRFISPWNAISYCHECRRHKPASWDQDCWKVARAPFKTSPRHLTQSNMTLKTRQSRGDCVRSWQMCRKREKERRKLEYLRTYTVDYIGRESRWANIAITRQRGRYRTCWTNVERMVLLIPTCTGARSRSVINHVFSLSRDASTTAGRSKRRRFKWK